MRILLAANASYVPPRGGATRSNLAWMDRLAEAGHECRILAAPLAHDAARREQMVQERIDADVTEVEPGVEVARRGPIAIWAVNDPGRRVRALREQIASFRPDRVLVSSEDLGHALLGEALASAPGRVVYLAHTPQFLPFGRESWNPHPQGAALAAACAGIVAIGRSMARYIEDAVGRPAAVIHPPIYGAGPFPLYRNFGRGLVTMINPCAVKGISIFLELAERFPAVEFGAVPGWGTTADDRRALDLLANVRVLPNCRDIDEALASTRVLLMPSLWYEGFGLIVMEAMLRGIPVIASDSGGLVEAKEGTGYVVPLRPIERYEAEFDETGMPRAVLPANEAGPWAEALDELLASREAYERESACSREAGLRFVQGLDADLLERFLLGLEPRGEAAQAATAHRAAESLPPERRALLLRRLRERRRETR
jgi:glycosyltransferase involved in cell wall biosynthesis